MTDEQIHDYLRSRALTTPPLDLVPGIVGAVSDAPQPRQQWFAPLLPAAGVVAAAAAVIVVGVIVRPSPGGTEPPGESGLYSHICAIPADAAIAYEADTTLQALGLGEGGDRDVEVAHITVTLDPIPVPPGQRLPDGTPETARYVCAVWDQFRTAEFFAIPADWEPPVAAESATAEPDRPAEDLLNEGDTLTIDAVDSSGRWGVIVLTRGRDYADSASTTGVGFGLQVFVEYRAERMPESAVFGADDWTVVRTNDGTPIGSRGQTPVATEPIPEALGTYSGAVDVFTTPTEGMLYWILPAEAADEDLDLVYQPSGAQTTVRISLRKAGRAADPVPSVPGTRAASPTPAPPIAIAESADADELFATPDTCSNPIDGYTLTFPDDWYTNTKVGDTPPCSWFTPEFFEVASTGGTPVEIWISVRVVTGVIGYTSITPVYSSDPVQIGGVPGHRAEFNPDPNSAPEQRIYHYVVDLGSQDRGPSFVASVSTTSADDYALGKAVLDRMVASLHFDR